MYKENVENPNPKQRGGFGEILCLLTYVCRLFIFAYFRVKSTTMAVFIKVT